MRKGERAESGGVFAEFLVAAPVFFGAIFLSVEVALLAYKFGGLNYAVSAAARWATLGETVPGLSRREAIERKVIEFAQVYGIALHEDRIFICPPGNAYGCDEGAFDGGSPNEYIKLSSRLPVTSVFGLYKTELRASTLGKNENFR